MSVNGEQGVRTTSQYLVHGQQPKGHTIPVLSKDHGDFITGIWLNESVASSGITINCPSLQSPELGAIPRAITLKYK